MKSAVVLLALAALASASLVARVDSSSTISSAPTTTILSLSPTATCLAACKPGDVNCEAACVGAAHPNSSQASETNDCAAKCPQGNGTLSESNAYAQCLQACISSYYPTSQTVAVAGGASGSVTANSATATGTGATGSAATGASGTKSSGSTATGSAATTSSSKAAGVNNVPLIGSAGGFVGLVMAIFAL